MSTEEVEFYSDWWETWRMYILPPVLGLVTITTVFGNLFVLHDFGKRLWKTPNSVSPTHFFIANLATADFLVGILVLPFLGLAQVSGEWWFGREWCTGWTFTHFWLCATSILSTCFVCVDRYVGVRFPFRHREIFSRRNTWMALFALWIFAGVPAFLRVFAFSSISQENHWRTCDLRQDVWSAVFAAVIVLYIPVAVIAVLYTKIFFIAKEHMKKKQRRGTDAFVGKSETPETSLVPKEDVANESSEGVTEVSKEDRSEELKDKKESVTEKQRLQKKKELTAEERQIRLAKRLSFLVGILVLSYFPYFTLILVRALYPQIVSGRVFKGFAWLRYFNSCLNPFIYAYAVPAYRKSIRRSVSKVTRKWSTNPSDSGV